MRLSTEEMEMGMGYERRANRGPPLSDDCIDMRVKYHDPDLVRQLIKDLSPKWELDFQGLEQLNEPRAAGQFYRFLRFRKLKATEDLR